MRRTTLCIALLAVGLQAGPVAAAVAVSGDLARDAEIGFRLSDGPAGPVVERLAEGSAAQRAGVADGDRVLAIDGTPVVSLRDGRERLQRLDGGRELSLRLERDGQRLDAAFVAPAMPFPEIEGFELEYGELATGDGARLRTLVAIPRGTDGRRPAVFFTQWVSCASITDWFASPGNDVLGPAARSLGLVVLLAERASDGDSEGPACHELDYDTELAHYRVAFDALVKHPRVDAAQVFVNGSSLGSTTAPLLAADVLADGGAIAGVAVQGGGAVTYYERMLNFDRIYLERRPDAVAPGDIHEEMLRRAAFHLEYLVKGRTPDAVAGDSAAMAAVRADVLGLGADEQYGRPFAWHQQAAGHDFLAAWAAIEAPVLVVFNEYDQYETEHGHRLIVDTVNRLRPGTATWVMNAGLDHSNYRYDSAIAAYADEGGSRDPAPLREALENWLRAQLAAERR